MPTLPSGKTFAISRNHLIEAGTDWFKAPEGHFWYWVADPEIMGAAPYEHGLDIIQKMEHAPVPRTSEELGRYIRVLEETEDGSYCWSGEYLAGFPQFSELSSEDMTAWHEWLNGEGAKKFFGETIELCQQLAETNLDATGMATFTSTE